SGRIEQPRSGSFLAEFVVGVAQRTGADRKTAAADAFVQMVAQLRHLADALVEIGPPVLRKPLPVGGRRGTLLRQGRERFADGSKWDAKLLRDLDHGHAAQDI